MTNRQRKAQGLTVAEARKQPREGRWVLIGGYYHDDAWPGDDQSCQVILGEDAPLPAIMDYLTDILNCYRALPLAKQQDWREKSMPSQFRAFHQVLLTVMDRTGRVCHRPSKEEQQLAIAVLGNIYILTEEGLLQNDNHNGMNFVQRVGEPPCARPATGGFAKS